MENINNNKNIQPLKNRNKLVNNVQKTNKTTKITSKNTNQYNKTNQKELLSGYIKTLLEIRRNLPNIIKIIDKLIERKASMLFPSTTNFTCTYNQTLSQVDKVIDLTERKDKLLNLHVITEEMLSCLNKNEQKLLILKYTNKNKIIDIANEMKITERSVYRKVNSLINKIINYLERKNWTTSFLNNQIGNETWIKDLIIEKINEDKIKKSKNHNKSSSSTIS